MRISKRSGVAIGVAAAGLLAAAASTYWLNQDAFSAAADIGRARKEAEAEGAIITPDQLRATFAPAAGDDAAPGYREAWGAFTDWSAAALVARRAWENGELGPLRETAAKEARAIALFDAPTRLTGCDFSPKWEDGPDMAVPELAQAEDTVRLLGGLAVLAATEGRLDEAEDRLRMARVVAWHSVLTPGMVGMEAGLDQDRLVCEAALWCAEVRPRDAAFRDRLRETVRNDFVRADAWRAIQAEMAVSWLVTDQIERFRSSPRVKSAVPANVLAQAGLPWVRDAWRSKTMLFWADVVGTHRRHVGNPFLYAVAMESLQRRWLDQKGVAFALLPAVVPADFGKIPRAARRGFANVTTALTVLDAMAVRAETGAWPKQEPRQRVDVFGTSRLRYQVEGGRLRVWSVGVDGRDEGGRGDDVGHTSPRLG